MLTGSGVRGAGFEVLRFSCVLPGSCSNSGRGSHFPSFVISTGMTLYFCGFSELMICSPVSMDTSRSGDGPPINTAIRSRFFFI